jgi:hypothetical protein
LATRALKRQAPAVPGHSFPYDFLLPRPRARLRQGKDIACRTLLYCKNGGGENDYVTLIREDSGEWFTARIDQIVSAPNPTLDIEDFSVA